MSSVTDSKIRTNVDNSLAARFQFSIRHLLIAITLVAVGTFAMLNAGTWLAASIFTANFFSLFVAILLAIYSLGERRAYWLGFAVVGAGFWLPIKIPDEYGREMEYLPTLILRAGYEKMISGGSNIYQPANAYSFYYPPATTSAYFSGPIVSRPSDPLAESDAVNSAVTIPNSPAEMLASVAAEVQPALPSATDPFLSAPIQAVVSTGSPYAVPSLLPPSGSPPVSLAINVREVNFTEFVKVGHSLFSWLAGFVGGIMAVWLFRRKQRLEKALA